MLGTILLVVLGVVLLAGYFMFNMLFSAVRSAANDPITSSTTPKGTLSCIPRFGKFNIHNTVGSDVYVCDNGGVLVNFDTMSECEAAKSTVDTTCTEWFKRP
jgi:hypothetical protein